MDSITAPIALLMIVGIAFLVMLGLWRAVMGWLKVTLAGCAATALGCAFMLMLGLGGISGLLRGCMPGTDGTPSGTTTTIPTAETSSPTTTSSPPYVADHFDYPLGEPDADGRRRGKGWVVTQDFADTVNPLDDDHSGQHLGEDWGRGGAAGQPVYAIADGEVLKATPNWSYGHFVVIKHTLPEGSTPAYVTSFYGHLATAGLTTEKWVHRGDVIGYVGESGDNGRPKDQNPVDEVVPEPWPVHLHFEVRQPDKGLADDAPSVGYSLDQAAFLNPTDATSTGNTPGGGWIDAHF